MLKNYKNEIMTIIETMQISVLQQIAKGQSFPLRWSSVLQSEGLFAMTGLRGQRWKEQQCSRKSGQWWKR